MKKIKMITMLVLVLTASHLHADVNDLYKGMAVNDETLDELTTTTTPNAFAYGISWLSQKTVGGAQSMHF